MEKYKQLIALATLDGFTDVHGGPEEGGMFWRGHKGGGLANEIPDYLTDNKAFSPVVDALTDDEFEAFMEIKGDIRECLLKAKGLWTD